MLFKYPNVLWALCLLTIPIIIHLFNLRRYQTVKFTNVSFLQDIVQDSRKSSQLKKWLSLLFRLLTIAFLVLAFAQPYSPNTGKEKKVEMVIYLDNSFSMQAMDNNERLLEKTIKELITYLPEQTNFSLFTNDNVFSNVNKSQILPSLLKISYSPNNMNLEAILAKGKSLFQKQSDTYKAMLIISDMKGFGSFPKGNDNVHLRVVSVSSSSSENTAILKASLKATNSNKRELKIYLQSDSENIDVPISVYDDLRLIAKLKASFSNYKSTIVLPLENKSLPKGKISIKDKSGLSYDDELFFSLPQPSPIKVMCIGSADEGYLKKIFDSDEFVFSSKTPKMIDYKDISHQDFIILNELTTISENIKKLITSFINQNGHLVIIPSENAQISQYNQLLKNWVTFFPLKNNPLRINDISFSHPLYKQVFTKQITNFKYPKVESSFLLSSNKLSTALSFENQSPFLISNTQLSVFSAALNQQSSNFQNSPLVVLSFYNLAKQSFKYPTIYYTILAQNVFDVYYKPSTATSLELVSKDFRFTPLQKQFSDKTRISTTTYPNQSANYEAMDSNKSITSVSYNYSRDESFVTPLKLPSGISQSKDVSSALENIKNKYQKGQLWKWFLMFALCSLFGEMLIVKLLK